MSTVQETSETYEASWPRLFSVAYKMTGSAADAEDIVHDAWSRRLQRPALVVQSETAWLYRTVSNLAIDHLRRSSRTIGTYHGPWLPEPVADERLSPEHTVEQRDQVSMALLLLLERLSPEQRVVWVLRTALEYRFADIAAVVGKNEVACRQIFRRARQNLQAHGIDRLGGVSTDLLDAFTSAIATGDPAHVMRLLAGDAVWIGDGGGVKLATMRPVTGSDHVARGLIGVFQKFLSQCNDVVPAMLNGAPALLVMEDGVVDTAHMLLGDGERITHALSIRNPAKLGYVTPTTA